MGSAIVVLGRPLWMRINRAAYVAKRDVQSALMSVRFDKVSNYQRSAYYTENISLGGKSSRGPACRFVALDSDVLSQPMYVGAFRQMAWGTPAQTRVKSDSAAVRAP